MKKYSTLAALWALAIAAGGLYCLCSAIYWSLNGDYARATWNFIVGVYAIHRKAA